jgi:protein TonB
MNTNGLNFQYQPRDPSRRIKGMAIVVVLHVIIAYALINGTAQKAFNLVKKPLQAVVIQEVIIPPPPPPPPPSLRQIVKQEAPRVESPPPPFVPPPEVAAPVTTAPVIQSVATPPPSLPVIAPPPPPSLPAVVQAGPARIDIRVACPTQVSPEMPPRAIKNGIEGVVKAQVLIKNGVVSDVNILSGPKVFHDAVKAAMMKYKCQASATDASETQEFVFKIEE